MKRDQETLTQGSRGKRGLHGQSRGPTGGDWNMKKQEKDRKGWY